MDNDTKQKLIVIAAVLAAILIFYYIASPYQNCLRYEANGQYANVKEYACGLKTDW